MIKNDKSVDSIINDQATNIWSSVLLPVVSRSKGKKCYTVWLEWIPRNYFFLVEDFGQTQDKWFSKSYWISLWKKLGQIPWDFGSRNLGRDRTRSFFHKSLPNCSCKSCLNKNIPIIWYLKSWNLPWLYLNLLSTINSMLHVFYFMKNNHRWVKTNFASGGVSKKLLETGSRSICSFEEILNLWIIWAAKVKYSISASRFPKQFRSPTENGQTKGFL